MVATLSYECLSLTNPHPYSAQDLSDMVAEHAAKQKKKRKAAEAKEDGKGRDGKGGAPQPKKYKEFKF